MCRWVLYTSKNSSLIQKSSQRMNCGSIISHYFSSKYREVRRTLYGSDLKNWYSFCKLGQSLRAAQVQEQSIAPGCGHLVQPSVLQPLGSTSRPHHLKPSSTMPLQESRGEMADTQPRSLARLQSATHAKTEQTLPNIQLPAPAQPLIPTWHFD